MSKIQNTRPHRTEYSGEAKYKIRVIYEDKDILVIDKPSGLSVHGDGKSDVYTLSDWILENYPGIKDVGEPMISSEGKKIVRPGIVHRLDKDTSGVLIVAKKDESFKFLKRQFKEREMGKIYLAIVEGRFKDESGIIDKPIGRSENDFRAKTTGASARGEVRSAITYYKVIEQCNGYSFLEIRPKTGRTHQIRVHLKSISKPIVCDQIYGKNKICPKWLGRLALHAFSLEIRVPGGERKLFVSPLPVDLKRALDKIRSL